MGSVFLPFALHFCLRRRHLFTSLQLYTYLHSARYPQPLNANFQLFSRFTLPLFCCFFTIPYPHLPPLLFSIFRIFSRFPNPYHRSHHVHKRLLFRIPNNLGMRSVCFSVCHFFIINIYYFSSFYVVSCTFYIYLRELHTDIPKNRPKLFTEKCSEKKVKKIGYVRYFRYEQIAQKVIKTGLFGLFSVRFANFYPP